jgi:hypothetical protein
MAIPFRLVYPAAGQVVSRAFANIGGQDVA